ncbi:elongation factor P 5-aminopentanone reductase [Niallia taxi]|uniref:elongation factor P 5-aminopentanone reductase n=1 Tax=Niallia taxi TaxID=2499688 RepID=UPI002E21C167|nr:SDR family oxidoreductase [Niallia taxi]
MGKHILITGATGEIGASVAKLLASKGYSLYLHYHKNEESLCTLLNDISQYGQEYIPIKADLSKRDAYRHVTSSIFALDGIVYASGVSVYGMLADLQDETLDQLWNLHVASLISITRELLPKLTQKQAGSIIAVSSIWGQVGASMEVAYSTVKGAQIAFIKALSKEMARNGIRVNAVAPGAIDTKMLSMFTAEEKEWMTEEIPMGRLGSAAEVAESVLFLLSDSSSYMTGQVLSLNGGWHM